MRPASVVVGILVIILWFIGATLIAAPSNVINMIVPSSLGLNSNEIEFGGIMAFVVAAIVIVLYTYSSEDESAVSSPPTPPPAPSNPS